MTLDLVPMKDQGLVWSAGCLAMRHCPFFWFTGTFAQAVPAAPCEPVLKMPTTYQKDSLTL